MLTRRDARMIASEVSALVPGSNINPNEVYLTIDEAADYLHMKKQTLYNKGNKLPRCKIGKRILYKKSDLQRLLER